MPKVNQNKLADDIQEIIIKQFLFTLTNLESPKQTAAFLSDFLTDAETIMLSKRLAIAILLIRGHSQTLITKMLSVSYSATGAVNSWLKNADPSTNLILNTIARHDEWKEIVYNYKLLNQKKKSTRGRKPKTITSKSKIDQYVNYTPIKGPADMETPDFEALEGPELITEEVEPNKPKTKGPSMEELLKE